MSDNDTALAALPPVGSLFPDFVVVGYLASFVFAVLGYDLWVSLYNSNAERRKKLLTLFSAVLLCWTMELLVLVVGPIEPLCAVFIHVMASFHYTLKVLVCYGYLVRMDLVFSSSKGKKKSTVPLKVYIFIVWTVNIVKAMFVYSSTWVDGGCVIDLVGFWGSLDEVLFGAADILTILYLIQFYRATRAVNKDSVASLVIKRILFLSCVTASATVFTVILINIRAENSLAYSIVDISVDVATMMKIYSIPKAFGLTSASKSKEGQAYSVAQRSMSSSSGSKVDSAGYSTAASTTGSDRKLTPGNTAYAAGGDSNLSQPPLRRGNSKQTVADRMLSRGNSVGGDKRVSIQQQLIRGDSNLSQPSLRRGSSKVSISPES